MTNLVEQIKLSLGPKKDQIILCVRGKSWMEKMREGSVLSSNWYLCVDYGRQGYNFLSKIKKRKSCLMLWIRQKKLRSWYLLFLSLACTSSIHTGRGAGGGGGVKKVKRDGNNSTRMRPFATTIVEVIDLTWLNAFNQKKKWKLCRRKTTLFTELIS